MRDNNLNILSTVSSGINSLAAVVWAEIPIHYRDRLPAQGASIRLAATFFGAAGVGLAFVVKPLGGIIQVVISAVGAIGGPLLGLILLGILCPAANHIGALTVFPPIIPVENDFFVVDFRWGIIRGEGDYWREGGDY